MIAPLSKLLVLKFACSRTEARGIRKNIHEQY